MGVWDTGLGAASLGVWDAAGFGVGLRAEVERERSLALLS